MKLIKQAILILLLNPLSVYSQKEDHQWYIGVIGMESFPNDSIAEIHSKIYNRTLFDFNYDPVKISFNYKDWKMDFRTTCTLICDTNGQMYAISNGNNVRDGVHRIMPGGDTINYDILWEAFQPNGSTAIQGALFLPWPDRDSILLFMARYEDGGGADQARYSIIDKKANNGFGSVVKKDIPFYNGRLKNGHINAVQHANGRDWWISYISDVTDKIRIFLLDKSGIKFIRSQTIGNRNSWGIGQSFYSQQGDQFAIIHAYTWDTLVKVPIYLMDFDRCEGKVTNIRTDGIYTKNGDIGFGLAFSPSGEYLYVNNQYEIRQYRTEGVFTGDFTIIDNYDGHFDPLPNSGDYFKTVFAFWTPGPDGMLYNTTASSNRFMHRMLYPDEYGLACTMQQHSLFLRMIRQTAPNFPNYRLGPLDGSSCDTLGLDNHPIAKYRYEGDTLDHLKVRFTDLSYFRPETWHWDFGDGTTFDGKKPYWHTFPKNGVYNVCLTVSNENSENTTCRLVTIGTNSIDNDQSKLSKEIVSVFPNPTDGEVLLTLSDYIPEHGSVEIYDLTGKMMMTSRIFYGWNNLDLSWLSAGTYLYLFKDGSSTLSSGKIVKI